jgi:hypothetical protein
MDNNNSDNYLTFINQSNTSIHSLLDLIRQQDQNYYNLLHLPPPAASYIPRSVSNLLPRSRRNSFHNRHERPTSIFMGSHRTTPLSFPSIPNNYNIVFNTPDNHNRVLPRRANINEDYNDSQPSALEIIRSTDTKVFSSIENPLNTSCPISQEDFTPNQEVLQIKYCGHIFKTQSLLTWFINRPTCPYCRFDIRSYSLNENSTNPENTSSEINQSNNTSEEDETTDVSHNIIDENTSIAQTITNTINTLLEDEFLDQSQREALRSREREFHFTVYGQRL